MFNHNDRGTNLDNQEETLLHLALYGWYDIDSSYALTLPSATDKQRNTPRALLIHLLHYQEKTFFHPLSQQVHHLRETHVCGVSTSIKLTALTETSIDIGIPNCWQLFHAQSEDGWGHEVSGLVLGYDWNVLIDIIFMNRQNGLLYYHEPLHFPTSIEHLELDCKVEYTNANQEIMPGSRHI